MYIQGVSTRKVSAILEEMCGLEISSTEVSRAVKLLDDEFTQWRNRSLGKFTYLILDARYEKVRQNGCVIDSAVLIACGVDIIQRESRARLRHPDLVPKTNYR